MRLPRRVGSIRFWLFYARFGSFIAWRDAQYHRDTWTILWWIRIHSCISYRATSRFSLCIFRARLVSNCSQVWLWSSRENLGSAWRVTNSFWSCRHRPIGWCHLCNRQHVPSMLFLNLWNRFLSAYQQYRKVARLVSGPCLQVWRTILGFFWYWDLISQSQRLSVGCITCSRLQVILKLWLEVRGVCSKLVRVRIEQLYTSHLRESFRVGTVSMIFSE